MASPKAHAAGPRRRVQSPTSEVRGPTSKSPTSRGATLDPAGRGRGIARVNAMSFVRVLLITALVVLPAFAQDPRLSDLAEKAIAKSGISGGRLGILIYSTQTEAPVYDRDAKKVLRLAS